MVVPFSDTIDAGGGVVSFQVIGEAELQSVTSSDTAYFSVRNVQQASFEVLVRPNGSAYGRSATLTLTFADGGEDYAYIDIEAPSLTIQGASVVAPPTGGYVYAYFEASCDIADLLDDDTELVVANLASWLTYVDYAQNGDTVVVRFQATANTGDRQRAGTAEVYLFNNNDTEQVTPSQVVTVVQAGTPEWVPAWSAKEVRVGYDAPTDYTIMDAESNEVIYTGTAYPRPTDRACVVRLSEVLRPFVWSKFRSDDPDDTGRWCRLFYVSYGEVVQSIMIYNNYTYDFDSQPTGIQSEAIPLAGPFVALSLCKASDALELHNVRGAFSGTEIEDIQESGDALVNRLYMLSNYVSLKCGDVFELVFGQWSQLYRYTGADYTLVYQNRKGGFDAVGVIGKVLRTDNITTETIEHAGSDDVTEHNGRAVLRKTIRTKWEFVLSPLTSEEAKNVPVLLRSPKAYLIKGDDPDDITAINITSSTAEHLNYTNNGRKLISYTIEAEESRQEQIR